MKIRSLHIEDYKLFKDFDIDFLDEKGEPLDIVVLAGVNGSGKSTILEYIYNFIAYLGNKRIPLGSDFIDIIAQIKENHLGLVPLYEIPFTNHKIEINNFQEYIDVYEKNIIYFPVKKDNTLDLKETIRQKYIDRAFEIDKPSKALEELQSFIEDIFSGLDLTFNLSSIDYNKNIVLFKDNNGVEFDIEALSTGEKTLLSKVLYLYFKDYKDKVILIDEPELSLHPSWQNRVLKIYENFAKLNKCQIIIATHSPHIIGSAKNEYLRVLKKIDKKIEVFKYDKSYGLGFDKVLTDIMSVENLRTPDVAKDIKRLWELLKEEAYDSTEYQELYIKLEELLGDLDQDLILARLEVAKIKSRHA